MLTFNRDECRRARDAAHDRITDAYWVFTRTRRGAPPSSVVPEAYRIRSLTAALLRMAGGKNLRPAEEAA